jgi:hypothetical protein
MYVNTTDTYIVLVRDKKTTSLSHPHLPPPPDVNFPNKYQQHSNLLSYYSNLQNHDRQQLSGFGCFMKSSQSLYLLLFLIARIRNRSSSYLTLQSGLRCFIAFDCLKKSVNTCAQLIRHPFVVARLSRI